MSQNNVPPGIATIAVHPTDPRAVVVAPGAQAGPAQFFVSSSPGAAVNLAVYVVNTTPPPMRQVFYDATRGFGPVQ